MVLHDLWSALAFWGSSVDCKSHISKNTFLHGQLFLLTACIDILQLPIPHQSLPKYSTLDGPTWPYSLCWPLWRFNIGCKSHMFVSMHSNSSSLPLCASPCQSNQVLPIPLRVQCDVGPRNLTPRDLPKAITKQFLDSLPRKATRASLLLHSSLRSFTEMCPPCCVLPLPFIVITIVVKHLNIIAEHLNIVVKR